MKKLLLVVAIMMLAASCDLFSGSSLTTSATESDEITPSTITLGDVQRSGCKEAASKLAASQNDTGADPGVDPTVETRPYSPEGEASPIEVVVGPDSVTVIHHNAHRQCYSEMDFSLEADGEHLVLTEFDHSIEVVACYCTMDYSIEITGLSPDKRYHIEVWDQYHERMLGEYIAVMGECDDGCKSAEQCADLGLPHPRCLGSWECLEGRCQYFCDEDATCSSDRECPPGDYCEIINIMMDPDVSDNTVGDDGTPRPMPPEECPNCNPDPTGVCRPIEKDCTADASGDCVCGGFAGFACPEGLECIYDDPNCDPANGGADCMGHCEVGGCVCPEYFSPVCGVDGVTYPNPCFARCSGSQILRDGPCGSECPRVDLDCPADSKQVCKDGPDNCVYCECAPIEDCLCPDIYQPVCGIDGQTYPNGCSAKCSGMEIKAEGECGAECPPVAQIRCSSDAILHCGRDAAGCEYCECVLRTEMCASSSDCPADRHCSVEDGDCMPPPDDSAIALCFGKCVENQMCICTKIWDPVCGSDGVVYGNSCEADCAGVPEYTPGECGSCSADAPCPDGMRCEFCAPDPNCPECDGCMPPVCVEDIQTCESTGGICADTVAGEACPQGTAEVQNKYSCPNSGGCCLPTP